MNETSGGNISSNTVDRRSFLKTGAKAAATVGIGVLVGNEIKKAEYGIQTNQGIFIPLYEMHGKGIDPLNIPLDINIFYREMDSPGGIMTKDPRTVLSLHFRPYDNPNVFRRVFPSDILDRLSDARADIMVGDAFIPDDKSSLMMEGEFGLGLGLMIAGINKSQAKLTRRGLFKSAAVSAASWLLSPLVSNGLKLAGYQTQIEAVKRIVARLEGIQSHLHPEITNVFFRNALIAGKLLLVAEEMKAKNGKIPKIAFNTEAQHSGIEDFLLAGRDFCREAVLLFPKDFLRSVIDANNGVEDFNSSRLISFEGYNEDAPQDLTITNDRKITDAQLVEGLKHKLSN